VSVVLAEFVGGPFDGALRPVAQSLGGVPGFYMFHVFETGTRQEIDRGDPPAMRLAMYQLARDSNGVPWFTARAQARYDWQGYRTGRAE
jgi:hypothetical protein